eukprot:gene9955-20699_t
MISKVYIYIREKLDIYRSYVQPPQKQITQRKVLLIHAHPVPESYSTCISKAVESGLQKAGHEVRVRRLYCHGDPKECYNGKTFEPVLTCEERRNYHDHDKINLRRNNPINADNNLIAADVQEAAADLRWCDSIIFVYPTWWFNMPAILKGYFDRVLLQGIGFELDHKGLHPALTNIKKIGVVSTYGSPWYLVAYAGDNGRQFISRGLRSCFAPTCQLTWYSLYDADSATYEERRKFLENIEESFKSF